MSIKQTFATGIKSGDTKVNMNPDEVKAAAEKLAQMPKEELEKRAEDPIGLLRDVGIHLDDDSAKALSARIDAAKSGAIPMAAIVHIDV